VSLLVRRQGHVIDLTANGHKLLDYARQIIGLNDRALREITGKAGCGRLRLGLPIDFFEMGFPEVVGKIRPLAGDLQLEIETDVSERLRQRCECGELDVAIFKLPTLHGSELPLLDLHLTWAGAPHLVPADGKSGVLPLVCFPEGCVYRKIMLRALRDTKIAHRTVLTTPSMESLRKAVRDGIGIAVLPTAVISQDKSLPSIDRLPELGTVSLVMAISPGSNANIRRVADGLGNGILSLASH
jgi:DNA-binding transcriptional LysR family regulator